MKERIRGECVMSTWSDQWKDKEFAQSVSRSDKNKNDDRDFTFIGFRVLNRGVDEVYG